MRDHSGQGGVIYPLIKHLEWPQIDVHKEHTVHRSTQRANMDNFIYFISGYAQIITLHERSEYPNIHEISRRRFRKDKTSCHDHDNIRACGLFSQKNQSVCIGLIRQFCGSSQENINNAPSIIHQIKITLIIYYQDLLWTSN